MSQTVTFTDTTRIFRISGNVLLSDMIVLKYNRPNLRGKVLHLRNESLKIESNS